MGTLVWDRIHRPDTPDVIEGWGGIAYALASASVALPAPWRILALVRVGADLADAAGSFLATLARVDASARVVVDRPNNRVELRYLDAAERVERLTGDVGSWPADELIEAAEPCDALLVNFISGRELALVDAERLRSSYDGPIYADLHSLLLGSDPDGRRSPRALPGAERWLRCFDAVQVNHHELRRVVSGFGAPTGGTETERDFAMRVVAAGPGFVFVTRGEAGVSWARRADVPDDPGAWPAHRRTRPTGRARTVTTGARTDTTGTRTDTTGTRTDTTGADAEITWSRRKVRPRRGDPTGCGDVWGAAAFAGLLAGAPVETAVACAGRLAGRSVEHPGTHGLADALGRSTGAGSRCPGARPGGSP